MITFIVLFSIIVTLLVAIIVCAPFSITIRTSKTISYEFQFGDCMPYVWVCAYWFAVMKNVETPEDLEYPSYGWILFSFWKTNSGKYINGKTTPDESDPYEDERRYDEDHDYCPGCGLSHYNCTCYLSL